MKIITESPEGTVIVRLIPETNDEERMFREFNAVTHGLAPSGQFTVMLSRVSFEAVGHG